MENLAIELRTLFKECQRIDAEMKNLENQMDEDPDNEKLDKVWNNYCREYWKNKSKLIDIVSDVCHIDREKTKQLVASDEFANFILQ